MGCGHPKWQSNLFCHNAHPTIPLIEGTLASVNGIYGDSGTNPLGLLMNECIFVKQIFETENICSSFFTIVEIYKKSYFGSNAFDC